MQLSDLNSDQQKAITELANKIYGANGATEMISEVAEANDLDDGDIHSILEDEFGMVQCMNCMVFYNEVMNDDGECSNCAE